MSLSEGDWEAVKQFLSNKTYVELVDDKPAHLGIKEMTLLTANNGWAIVWMHDKYYLRHLACGGYLLHHVDWGCLCGKGSTLMGVIPVKVDDMILLKFKLITKGDKK